MTSQILNANHPPVVEKFADYLGNERSFELSLYRQVGSGYVFTAREITDSPEGYEFDSFSCCPSDGMAILRRKIRSGLSTRYLANTNRRLSLLSDKISGRIDSDGIVIDGALVSWENFNSLLLSHDGFQIDIRVTDPAC